ncbi:o-succinylbenzoate synthase [Photobacterium sp. 1_MG-2023]|uniref:o-succinylbenzoate synthase n=1 Tax=Photobacterium sp. 1_MG-2023 TaxID=3062646 RepID=UPI0026E29CD7|nr:o-succinylbenzoate synthase [Photobacterium sp. 1_MG-2023]MDO6707198.1 o-succinylbenzoate synthase [Photobacterium sp. 1_MG-2023]
MTQRSARLYAYRLSMDSGVVLRGRRVTERRGYIAELHEGAGSGLGEIAPLSGWSAESLAQAGAQAALALSDWVHGSERMMETATLFPSVAFGLSMAEMELTRRLPAAGAFTPAPLLRCDAAVTLPSTHRIAKVKVGRGDPAQESEQINRLLTAHPALVLRLDANRAWTLSQARVFSAHLRPDVYSRIAFIEEPCQQPQDSLNFAAESHLPLAWDETLQAAVSQPDFQFEQLGKAAAIVVKPTLIGSVQRCLLLIQAARQSGMQAVLSSSLESSIGLTQIARLSHWLLPDAVPGLDTLHCFQSQLECPWPGSPLPVQQLSAQTLVGIWE